MLKSIQFYFRRFWIKCRNWEYWHTILIYALSGIYYAICVIRLRAFFFYSASNPSIDTGGMFFESKNEISKLIPINFQPITIFIQETDSLEHVKKSIDDQQLKYPIICKPDRGEQGWKVEKINDFEELKKYYLSTRVDFLIQEFVDFPLELGIFYYRFPSSNNGHITSITNKVLLRIVGNGVDSLEKLILNDDRAFMQYKNLQQKFSNQFKEIIPQGKEMILSNVGNHIRGALFLDANKYINPELNSAIDDIAKTISGFYFGRFDIKCNSINELSQKKNFKIIELNGAGSIPTHIFQPKFSFIEGQKVLLTHIYLLYKISKENAQLGVKYMDLKTYRQFCKSEKEYKLKANKKWN